MPDDEYKSVANYAVNKARYGRAWTKGTLETVVPQGDDVREDALRASSEFVEPDASDCHVRAYYKIDERGQILHENYSREPGDKDVLTVEVQKDNGSNVLCTTARHQLSNLNEEEVYRKIQDLTGVEVHGEPGKSNDEPVYRKAYDFTSLDEGNNEEELDNPEPSKPGPEEGIGDVGPEDNGKPVIEGNGPHGTNPEYDFEEHDLFADGLADLSKSDELSHGGPQQ